MRKKVLIIGHVWPEPKSSAAGSRMMQLIEFFQAQDYEVVFSTACAKSVNAFNLASLAIRTEVIELNSSSFDTFVRKLNPEIVIFDRFMSEEQFGWRVYEGCPNALRILDTEDLHCLRKGRQMALKDLRPFDDFYLFNETAKREIASIYRCDLSLIISEAEMKLLKNQFKVDDSLLFYLPFLRTPISKENTRKLPSFQNRSQFMTIGNFLHEPNYNAILYLKETIWPLIRRQLPQAELHIYGAYASQRVTQLHSEREGFIIKGYAEDVNDVMQLAKVCLAPLRFGAGLKGKVVDAMQNGTPSVMTSIAAEGIFGYKMNGCVEDNPEDFAKSAVELYQNEKLWTEKQQFGFEVLNQRFNKDVFYLKFISSIEEMLLQLQNHRMKNFTGQLLQHHSLQSTKYMSKWIEEKNEKHNPVAE